MPFQLVSPSFVTRSSSNICSKCNILKYWQSWSKTSYKISNEPVRCQTNFLKIMINSSKAKRIGGLQSFRLGTKIGTKQFHFLAPIKEVRKNWRRKSSTRLKQDVYNIWYSFNFFQQLMKRKRVLLVSFKTLKMRMRNHKFWVRVSEKIRNIPKQNAGFHSFQSFDLLQPTIIFSDLCKSSLDSLPRSYFHWCLQLNQQRSHLITFFCF